MEGTPTVGSFGVAHSRTTDYRVVPVTRGMNAGEPFEESRWRSELEDHRRRKDEFFAEHPHSPIPQSERPGFTGLDYYPPDPDYRLEAMVTSHTDPERVTMETTTGEEQVYERVVTLSFELDGRTVDLAGYRPLEDDGELFVPFRDETSGDTTYGAGRYLEVDADRPLADGDRIVVDFNMAYSPFCAYNDAYTCPLPPTENWLEVAIEAGERYEGDH